MISDENDALSEKCEQLALRHDGMGEYCLCQTFYDDGWWSANVASEHRCIGVYGHVSESAALRALLKTLAASLVKP